MNKNYVVIMLFNRDYSKLLLIKKIKSHIKVVGMELVEK